jgi:hypothetical protein
MAQNDGWEDVSHELTQPKDDGWEDVSHEIQKNDEGFSGETALRSLGNSATLGYADNLRAAAEPAVFGALNMLTGQDVDSDGDYVERRDAEIKRSKKLAEENPAEHIAGTVGGALLTSVVPGAAAAKGATAGARILNAAKTGAAMGLAANPGETEGELSGPQLAERIRQGGTGAVLGAGLQGVGEGVSKIAEKAPGFFKELAREKALKQAGANKKALENLRSSGKFNDAGDLLLDEVITPLSRPKDIAEKVSEKAGKAMSDVSGYIKQADEILQRPQGFNLESSTPEQIRAAVKGQISTDQIKSNLMKEIRESMPGVPEEELAPAFSKVETWFKDRPEYMSASELQQMKVGLNNFLKKSDFYKDMPGISKEGLLAVRRGAKEAIEQKGNAAAEILGDSAGKIKNTNKRLGNLLEIQDMSADAIARDAANRSISLTDTIAGAGGLGAGAVFGGPAAIATAAGAAGVNKLGRMYGNSLMATGSNAVAEGLKSISPKFAEMAQKNPQGFSLLVQNLAQNPKFSPKPQGPSMSPFMERLGNDPKMQEVIQNDRLKEQLKKYQEKKNINKPVSQQEAQASFIEGN